MDENVLVFHPPLILNGVEKFGSGFVEGLEFQSSGA
jgi:hypothetical protein